MTNSFLSVFSFLFPIAWFSPVEYSSWKETIADFYLNYQTEIRCSILVLICHVAFQLVLKLSRFLCRATWAYIATRQAQRSHASPYQIIAGLDRQTMRHNAELIETLTPLHLNALAVKKSVSSPPQLPPPAKFNRTKDVDQWIKTFEFYIHTNGIANKVQTLLASLDEDTFQSLTSIKGINFQDSCYEALRTAMTVLYSKPQPSIHNIHKLFKDRSQQPDENLALYYLTLTNLAETAFPNASPEHMRSIVTERFIDGLADKRVKLHLLTNGCPMTEDVLTTAIRIQKAFDQVCPMPNQHPPNEPPQQPPETPQWSQKPTTRWSNQSKCNSYNSAKPKYTCRTCGMEGHSSKFCPQGSQGPQGQQSQINSMPEEQNAQQPNNNNNHRYQASPNQGNQANSNIMHLYATSRRATAKVPHQSRPNSAKSPADAA